MTWDQMLDIPIEEATTGQMLTDIECPECGRKIYLNTGIILTSYPAKYSYWCACGWSGYSHIKWSPDISRLNDDISLPPSVFVPSWLEKDTKRNDILKEIKYER